MLRFLAFLMPGSIFAFRGFTETSSVVGKTGLKWVPFTPHLFGVRHYMSLKIGINEEGLLLLYAGPTGADKIYKLH